MTPVEISIGASGYNWWDLVPAIVGGFAGAVAGGIASYVLAVRGSREIRDRDSDDRLQRTRARVFRTFSEFVQIFSSFGTIYENVITQLRLSSCRLGDHAPNQRAIRPLANLGSERLVTFDADDIAPFFEQQRDDFVNDLLVAGNKYNSLIETLRQFATLKNELLSLSDILEFESVSNDGSAILKTTDEQVFLKVKAMEVRLETLATPMLDQMTELMELLFELADQFSLEAKAVLGKDARVPGFEPQSLMESRTRLGIPKKGQSE
ncbi:hypothetical protein AAG596_01580 [Citromicrobium bathyomarinum]|uniref:hypothetical protein n=1 Tax=Citromicrobium bathyomarinum TaxID=72174 RepID=UPI00315A8F12